MTDFERADKLAEQLSQVLLGHPPNVQGAAITAALAIWVREHTDKRGEPHTTTFRRQLMKMVFDLVEVAALVYDPDIP